MISRGRSASGPDLALGAAGAQLAGAADRGRLWASVQNVYPLEDARDALEELAAGSRGKIALLYATD